MTKIIAQAYPSTSQFRQAAKFLAGKEREVVLIGTVKIHGTNGSFIQFEPQGKIYKQSKSRLLDPTHDNFGFCNNFDQFDLQPLFDQVIALVGEENVEYPIEIAGEWAGKNVDNGRMIQKGVAVSEVEQFFSIFGVRLGAYEDNCGRKIGWLPSESICNIALRKHRIYNIFDFGSYDILLDTNFPQMISNQLAELTEMVEEECPVGKFFGVKGIGEGIVWKPANNLGVTPESWFKVKGKKHTVCKVKTLAPVDVEKLNSINEFVEYAVTENRLEQGLQEVGLDQKLIGKFIGWVNQDIHKEEQDTLEANGLTMKEVGRPLSNKARDFYLAKLQEV